MILGFAFPYDDISPRKVNGWVGEIVASNMVIAYEHDACPYLAFRKFRDHQQINKATPSKLPPPPDRGVVSANTTGERPDNDGSPTGVGREDSFPHAQARGSVPIPSVPVVDVEPSERPVARPDIDRLCGLLADRMLHNNPKAKTAPESDAWRDPMRLLLDVDGHDEQSVAAVVEWCQADEFWRSNILSPAKLRKQFDQLTLKSKASTVRPAARPANDNGLGERTARRRAQLEASGLLESTAGRAA
jgi:hypothetical protein